MALQAKPGLTYPISSYNTQGGGPGGYEIAGYRYFTFYNLVLRGNLLRNRDGLQDPSPVLLWGMFIDNAQNLVVEDNVINFTKQYPISHQRCEKLKFLNNQRNDGTPVRGEFWTPHTRTPFLVCEDLFDIADDWLLGL
jgi:hypothetical protein